MAGWVDRTHPASSRLSKVKIFVTEEGTKWQTYVELFEGSLVKNVFVVKQSVNILQGFRL